MITKIRKRDGTIVRFDRRRITNAIKKAFEAVKEKYSKKDLDFLANGSVKEIFQRIKGIPDVEQVQNIVEESLSRSKFGRVAKAYMLYRRSRTRARELREFFGVKDDMKFDVNAIRVLQERYLLKDKEGKIIETPTQLFRRVAKAVASVEGKDKEKWEKRFFEIMKNLEFIPNSPTLMNAGTPLGQLSACFVLPVEDSLESLFNTLKNMAIIQQSGGGTGFSFSKLRPKGDIVQSTKGVSSGPVSFMKIYDQTTEVIKQGGKRRGANMGILNISHPDILEFATAKKGSKALNNFNISVAADDKFMKAVQQNKNYSLINPKSKKIAAKINAKKLFDFICKNAWETGDPGMIFIDEINKKHPLNKIGKIESTNPCGEVPLLPYEACNLGSINLSKFVINKKIDWEKLKDAVEISIRFLDNVIDENNYPLKEIDKIAKANRKIGLGVMGFADALIEMEIPYDSPASLKLSEKIMRFISKISREASEQIGKEKGNFPNFKNSNFKKRHKFMRNATINSIAPTGTIGIIANCSSGIEPLFAIAFMREVMAGKKLFEINKKFQEIAVRERFYSENLINKIAKQGNLKGIKEIPEKIKKLFKTALEVPYEHHIKIQAAFQKSVDNATSKTINLPENSSVEDIKKAYMLAWKLKCKGITIYRYGSKPKQVLYLGQGKEYSKADIEFSGGTCIGRVCSF